MPGVVISKNLIQPTSLIIRLPAPGMRRVGCDKERRLCLRMANVGRSTSNSEFAGNLNVRLAAFGSVGTRPVDSEFLSLFTPVMDDMYAREGLF